MLIDFFLFLKKSKLPVSIREFLDLLKALKSGMAYADLDAFYYLSRLTLVKDERHFDKFDQAFTQYFDGIQTLDHANLMNAEIPDEWLRKEIEKMLTAEEIAALKPLGDLQKLMEEFEKRLQEQKERHQGGNKWIGTGGTSPYGAYGYNPAGFRIGGASRNKTAVKVWEKRQFANLDDQVQLGVRNIKVALRRLRKMARKGSQDLLDIDSTISATAKQAGWLDLKMVAERRNQVKVLLFFDVGGSMDPHIKTCEELFSAARTEFKHMEYFYFHNCIYDSVWKNNMRRLTEKTSIWDILHKYGKDYKVIFIGDAAMSPYEVATPGGCIEDWNEEAGEVWLKRITDHFDRVIWLNPEPERTWSYIGSTVMIQKIFKDTMFPLTLSGLEKGIRYLV